MHAQTATGASFLELPHNAKEHSYGKPANIKGIENIFSDAAATLAFFDETPPAWQSSMGYYTFFETIKYANLAVSYTLPQRWGSLGLGVLYLDYGKFENIDERGNNIGQLGSFDTAVFLNYSIILPSHITVGTNAKFFRQKIAEYTANNFAFDIASKKAFFWGKYALWLALDVENMGPDTVFISEGSPLPMAVRTAVNFEYKNIMEKGFDISIGPQFKYKIDETINYGIGIETSYHLKSISFFLRSSYMFDTISDSSFAIGMGMEYKISRVGIDLSGAYLPANLMGDKTYLSLSFSYRQPREKLKGMPQTLEEYWLEKPEDKKENGEKENNK
ncbi:MAG: hypothetical protein OEZ22_03520 [Spirochaetia bacterium]|nr:hypothetical protein [Spirochaetia bacterium]